VLAMPFAHIEVQSTDGDLHIRLTRKGKVLMTRGKPRPPDAAADLAHNRPKDYLLVPREHGAFLRALGIADRRGQVRPTMQGKFAQVNEFLRIIDQTVVPLVRGGGPMCLVDCGCGSAHLTFAAYHFLHDVRGLDVRVAGIDVKADLVRNCEALRDELGWQGLEYSACTIRDFQPPSPVDAVLSLHACDTATDEAIASGVQWTSRVILAAPCCQHELHHQLDAASFRPLLRHGILRERLADLLTDTFRALALRIMGYRTAVVEFVSPEHTAKNLLIRAEAGLKRGQREFVREYATLRDFWKVRPAIEQLLGEGFVRLLSVE
ncbi:MAG: SAM-dependent methyltransferase, partial [Phycisphaerae bacterium]|nr:SAM-dependent methyltransferase [Phycisphaerae bacterium]